jgi:glycosyltransferase involved in cell wall biosynthesis
MMTSLGHEVYLYAGPENEADCTEHICCTYKKLPTKIPAFDANLPIWKAFNAKCIGAIKKRAQPGDFLCIIGGDSNKRIAAAFPELICVEFGIGYGGVFAPFRVYESYAWMHTVTGAQTVLHGGSAHDTDGRFYDQVIPNYFEVEDFPFGDGGDDYLLYVGRLTARKGLVIVGDIARRTGLKLVVAGAGDMNLIPEGAEYLGVVGPAERAKVMGAARCIITPTIYIEPFGGVAVEAQLCGTPAITTDWGAFSETVQHGKTGFRCHTLAEFCWAVDQAPTLDREYVRERAISMFSTETVKYRYQAYFERLTTLAGMGWYS